MERERKVFKVFLSMHASKALATEEPVAYLQFYDECIPADAPLIKFTREDIIDCSELDHNSELVRFLLHQMTTYDCRTQRIVGLIFNKNTVISDVLRMPE
tara:strand:- start:2420 stop:2719 length:300 start_codon:yes stop_codon:yes gene_type:complete